MKTTEQQLVEFVLSELRQMFDDNDNGDRVAYFELWGDFDAKDLVKNFRASQRGSEA